MAKETPLVPEFWNDFGECYADREILGHSSKCTLSGKLFLSSRSSDPESIYFRWIGTHPFTSLVEIVDFSGISVTINASDQFKRTSKLASEEDWGEFMQKVKSKWAELHPDYVFKIETKSTKDKKDKIKKKKKKKEENCCQFLFIIVILFFLKFGRGRRIFYVRRRKLIDVR
jgi:hypothetical protein